MRITNRERRDWTLIIFIIPIGIILMMIAGQIAVRIVPQWSVNAGMKSLLDPQTAPKQQIEQIQPVLPEILTPMSWLDTFLTPNSNAGDQDIVFPPFIVFEPTATPSPTASPEPSPTVTETPIASASPSPSPTTVTTVPTATKTKKPPDNKTPTPITATPVTPTATLPSVTSTIDPSLIEMTPPSEINLGTPDGNPGVIPPGSYIILNLPVEVKGPADTDYDLVYYESESAPGSNNVQLDHVIVGISKTDLSSVGSVYYEVFNWGDNIPDTNTNVDINTLPPDAGCVAECDNRNIPTADLHPDPGGGTGILIDVDNASSAPPAGTYDYIIIISPSGGGPPGDGSQIDAIEVTEVPPIP